MTRCALGKRERECVCVCVCVCYFFCSDSESGEFFLGLPLIYLYPSHSFHAALWLLRVFLFVLLFILCSGMDNLATMLLGYSFSLRGTLEKVQIYQQSYLALHTP